MSDIYESAKVDFREGTPVEVANQCMRALIDQGGRCLLGCHCVYFGEGGKRCVVGMLLPENLSGDVLFGGVVALSSLLLGHHKYKELGTFLSNNLDLLALLQSLHDRPGEVPPGCIETLTDLGVEQELITKWIEIGVQG